MAGHVVFNIIHQLAHHEDAQPTLFANLNVFFKIRIAHLARVEADSLVNDDHGQATAADNGADGNFAVFNIPIPVANNIGAGFVNNQLKGIDNLIGKFVFSPDAFNELPHVFQIRHLRGNLNFFF